MIRFGSRVDLYLPSDFEAWVQKDDRVRAGETLVGKLP
jgi:phosphatidylserine decarboxylase